METIEKRLGALERKVGWYRRLLIGLGLLVVCVVCVAANNAGEVAEIVRTKTLEIVNDDGNVVARLQAIPDKPNPHGGVTGGGRLALFDSKGRDLVSAGPSIFGGTFEVNQTQGLKQQENKEAKGRLSIFAADWGAMIVLLDQDGRLMWKEPTGK